VHTFLAAYQPCDKPFVGTTAGTGAQHAAAHAPQLKKGAPQVQVFRLPMHTPS
jgi:hypothetical protein